MKRSIFELQRGMSDDTTVSRESHISGIIKSIHRQERTAGRSMHMDADPKKIDVGIFWEISLFWCRVLFLGFGVFVFGVFGGDFCDFCGFPGGRRQFLD